MFKILFSIFCIIAFLVAAGFLVSGLIKNNKKLWQTALAVMVLSIMIPSFLIVKGVKDTVTYVQSDQVIMDAREAARHQGKLSTSMASGLIEGGTDGLDEEVIADAANKGARISGRVTEGVAGGIDGTVGTTSVQLTPEAAALGVEVGRSQVSDHNTVKIFTSFNKPFKGTLKLTTYDSEGQKMDVTTLQVDKTAETEENIIFRFKDYGPGLSGSCKLHAYSEM